MNNSANIKQINNKNKLLKEKELKDKKEWKKFQSTYTFLIIALFIYTLRPLTISRNNEELSYILDILNKKLTKENYKDELEIIIRHITTIFVTINSIKRENIVSINSVKNKILRVLGLLFKNIKSFNDFYIKIIEYEPSLTNNKKFFNFIASLINFENVKKETLNSEIRNNYIIFLLKRVENSPLNSMLSKKNTNNSIINNDIKQYKDLLIKISASFFKNMAKNNNVNFVNSKVFIKNNSHTTEIQNKLINTSSESMNLTKPLFGGNKNMRLKNINKIK